RILRTFGDRFGFSRRWLIEGLRHHCTRVTPGGYVARASDVRAGDSTSLFLSLSLPPGEVTVTVDFWVPSSAGTSASTSAGTSAGTSARVLPALSASVR